MSSTLLAHLSIDSEVTLCVVGLPGRCSARVVSCSGNEVELLCRGAQRLPRAVARGVGVTLVPANGAREALRGHVVQATATVARVAMKDFEGPATPAVRGHARVLVDEPADLVLRGTHHRARITDISIGGCGLTTAAPIGMGDEIAISTWLGPRRVQAVGTVVRYSPTDKPTIADAGLRFTGLAGADRAAIAEHAASIRGRVPHIQPKPRTPIRQWR
jgi:hypothetical protein